MSVRCSDCGKFIGYVEMSDEGGASFFYEPESEFGHERCEWTCAQCNQQSTRADVPVREPACPNKRAGTDQ